MNISAMSKREKIEAIELLEEKQRRIDADQLGIMYRSMSVSYTHLRAHETN